MTLRWLAMLFVLAAAARGGAQPPQATARVNGEIVTAAEVEREVRQAYGDRKFAEFEQQRLFQAALARK